MGQLHVTPGGFGAFRGDRALRLCQKCVNALDARHGGLDSLDLHAQAFNGRKNTRYVVNNGHRSTNRHTKQRQSRAVARRREQHNDTHHHGVQRQHGGGVDGIIEIRAFHRGIAVCNALVIAALHVGFHAQCANRADVVQRLGHLAGNGGHSAAVVQLGGQHPLLHMAGEHRKQWQHQQQNQRQAGIFYKNDRHDRNDAAGVRHHADDA